MLPSTRLSRQPGQPTQGRRRRNADSCAAAWWGKYEGRPDPHPGAVQHTCTMVNIKNVSFKNCYKYYAPELLSLLSYLKSLLILSIKQISVLLVQSTWKLDFLSNFNFLGHILLKDSATRPQETQTKEFHVRIGSKFDLYLTNVDNLRPGCRIFQWNMC